MDWAIVIGVTAAGILVADAITQYIFTQIVLDIFERQLLQEAAGHDEGESKVARRQSTVNEAAFLVHNYAWVTGTAHGRYMFDVWSSSDWGQGNGEFAVENLNLPVGANI